MEEPKKDYPKFSLSDIEKWNLENFIIDPEYREIGGIVIMCSEQKVNLEKARQHALENKEYTRAEELYELQFELALTDSNYILYSE